MSILYDIIQNVPEFNSKHPNYKKFKPSIPTRKEYLHHTVRFGEWYKMTTGRFNFKEVAKNISEILNDYSRYLSDQGLSAYTIHNYLNGVCYAYKRFGARLKETEKPIRHAHDNHRRDASPKPPTYRSSRECSPRFYDFAKMVGLRRGAIKQLFGKCLRIDESGYLCIAVPKDKNGKFQLQRILPEYIEQVSAYFDGSDDYIFSQKEQNNDIDVHYFRGEIATKAFLHYNFRIMNEPGYAEQLGGEVRARWERLKVMYESPKHKEQLLKQHPSWRWDEKLITGLYHLRGENRKWAQDHHLPTEYSRLALLATSIFFLSHWRCNVAINNYILPHLTSEQLYESLNNGKVE